MANKYTGWEIPHPVAPPKNSSDQPTDAKVLREAIIALRARADAQDDALVFLRRRVTLLEEGLR